MFDILIKFIICEQEWLHEVVRPQVCPARHLEEHRWEIDWISMKKMWIPVFLARYSILYNFYLFEITGIFLNSGASYQETIMILFLCNNTCQFIN